MNKSISSLKLKKRNALNPSSLLNNTVPRTHFRNFSHISEFGSGLEFQTKSNTKKDKIDEFLEKKRERNTIKRLLGRKKT